jgi:hypothetical protein
VSLLWEENLQVWPAYSKGAINPNAPAQVSNTEATLVPPRTLVDTGRGSRRNGRCRLEIKPRHTVVEMMRWFREFNEFQEFKEFDPDETSAPRDMFNGDRPPDVSGTVAQMSSRIHDGELPTNGSSKRVRKSKDPNTS